VGGMILGPIVQKYAFGAFWTGFPLGYDLTDNKTLLMWLVWVGACGALGLRWAGATRERVGRAAVVVATVLMLAVYLVPHSMRGSQLDYEQLEQGVDPAGAIRTGR
jgi:Na+/melibiose symporter-like transporter